MVISFQISVAKSTWWTSSGVKCRTRKSVILEVKSHFMKYFATGFLKEFLGVL